MLNLCGGFMDSLYSLACVKIFIKSCKIENKMENIILQLACFIYGKIEKK